MSVGWRKVNRLEQQLAFLREIDKLKRILRKSRIFDGTREETSAEHSWHLAMLVGWLHEYAREPVDPFHSVKMALVHDIVEIDRILGEIEASLAAAISALGPAILKSST